MEILRDYSTTISNLTNAEELSAGIVAPSQEQLIRPAGPVAVGSLPGFEPLRPYKNYA